MLIQRCFCLKSDREIWKFECQQLTDFEIVRTSIATFFGLKIKIVENIDLKKSSGYLAGELLKLKKETWKPRNLTKSLITF